MSSARGRRTDRRTTKSAAPAAPLGRARRTPGRDEVRRLDRFRMHSEARNAAIERREQPARGATVVCTGCGAVYRDRTWRRGRALGHTALAAATWRTCPGCKQVSEGSARGLVLVQGGFVAGHRDAIAARIRNVADLEASRQPLRQLLSIAPLRDGLEVRTTSQKLAHRIVHELKKAFRGRATYRWSDDDGTLTATWQRDA